MARRSAERSGETHLLMVAPAARTGRSRRVRSVPVTDLLAREGKPLSLGEEFLLADAVASVRKGMAGLAAGVLALAGVAVMIDDGTGGGGGMAVPDVARPAEAATPHGPDVQKASSATKRASAATRSSKRRTARQQPLAPQDQQAPRITTL